MSITLDGITLHPDLEWQDEFDWTPVQQSVERSLSGKMLIEEATKIKGRPITLYGGQNAAWHSRSTVALLQAKLTAGTVMTLVYHGTTYSVCWRHDATPLEAAPVVRTRNPGSGHKYTLTIRLMEVSGI